MSKAITTYLETIQQKLALVQQQQGQIEEIAAVIAAKIQQGQSLFVFGASHAGIISEELTYRAGGLALFNPVFNPSLMLNVRPITLTSELERLEQFGRHIINASKLTKGDVILIHSVSGRNRVIIDAAMTAKAIGATVIGLTSLTTAKQVNSKHASGKLLCDIADYVIDNHGELGDASVHIDGLKQKAAPTSTVLGATIVNSLSLAISEALLRKGIEPPVLASANIDDNDAINRSIFKQHAPQIHYL